LLRLQIDFKYKLKWPSGISLKRQTCNQGNEASTAGRSLLCSTLRHQVIHTCVILSPNRIICY